MKTTVRIACAAALTLLLAGCAASYVRYEVTDASGCAPSVITDSAMGVSVRVESKEIHCEKR
ncbi:hypothetical protein [Aeromonas enteropelogenes]|uniref:hypothetical protein n=1 Tax=Aeromonas enteropelogenes TaxID=29489 RepID=UPI003B9FA205